MTLEDLGWNPRRADELRAAGDGLAPARVVAEHRGMVRIVAERAELWGVPAGTLRRSSARHELPTVGDWVAIEGGETSDKATIVAVLPRHSEIRRKLAGRTSETQLIAANVDVVFIVVALEEGFSARRIERALAQVWSGGARPVIVLSKADVCADTAAYLTAAEAVAPETPIHLVSAVDGRGMAAVEALLEPRLTVALIGTSGVGKSTLINRLAGSEVQGVGEVRADDRRGRHTTTHRQLLSLPGGALMIDTPGMRELGLMDDGDGGGGLTQAFDDVEVLAVDCRFNDCAHLAEPGCAVTAAVAAGSLQSDRLEAFQKLERELAHQALRTDALAAIEEKRKWKRLTQAARNRGRSKRDGI